MKTCPYCGSKVETIDHSRYYCEFCTMNISSDLVKKDGVRISVVYKEGASKKDLEKSTPELMTLSTVNLLFLLKEARTVRTDITNEIRKLKKEIQNAGSVSSFKEAYVALNEDYIFFSKKMYVIENIIKTRLGYIPPRLDKPFFEKYLKNVKNKKKNLEPMKDYSKYENQDINDILNSK
ncbi:hypothetical protein N1I81_22845 [Bacillus sp. FSL M8-0052]|uniref:Uncharacterized protein n=1 Tax=Bacillus glycinifermentans TaxID=1664069 RepID=A0AAJ3Z5G2_9BACI|nr:hypothetical protein [Bacillus glycinifermentans]QAT68030.1 hypothetical protein EQZ20_24465 [Bacillus glycinifermentans]